MRLHMIAFALGACLLTAPAALAETVQETPLCDGVKKPTEDGQDPDKASAGPLCDGVKKPTEDGQDPDKA